MLKTVITYFLPEHLRNNSFHPEYEGVYGLVNGVIWASIFLLGMAFVLYLFDFPLPVLFYNSISILIVLPFVRRNKHELAFLVNGFFLYLIYFPVILNLGGIYSVSLALLYPFLLGGLFGLPKYGMCYLGGNIIFLLALYFQTPASTGSDILQTKIYALLIHLLSTLLTGGLYWFLEKKKEVIMIDNKNLQNLRIDVLNDEVARRTEEINSMRQTLAADFHDETGNLLSAITRQATQLKLKVDLNSDTQAILEHIIASSNQLYDSSRHFLWHLNQDSDDPLLLFDYLTSLGQLSFNPLTISFSADYQLTDLQTDRRLPPFAAINLIFIFREAMTNVIKHAGASEVQLTLRSYDEQDRLEFGLTDNGHWKQPDPGQVHHGLSNIQKRCQKHHFHYILLQTSPTRLAIRVPLLPTV